MAFWERISLILMIVFYLGFLGWITSFEKKERDNIKADVVTSEVNEIPTPQPFPTEGPNQDE